MTEFEKAIMARRQDFAERLAKMVQDELRLAKGEFDVTGIIEIKAAFIYMAQECARQAATSAMSPVAMGLINPRMATMLCESLERILTETLATGSQAILRGEVGKTTPKADAPVAGMSLEDLIKGAGL